MHLSAKKISTDFRLEQGISLMKFFANIKLSNKIYLLISLVLLCQLFIGGKAIISMSKISDELRDITEFDMPLTEKTTQITIHQLEQEIWFERALRFGEMKTYKTHQNDFENTKKQFNFYAHKINKEITQAKVISQLMTNKGSGFLTQEQGKKRFTSLIKNR